VLNGKTPLPIPIEISRTGEFRKSASVFNGWPRVVDANARGLGKVEEPADRRAFHIGAQVPGVIAARVGHIILDLIAALEGGLWGDVVRPGPENLIGEGSDLRHALVTGLIMSLKSLKL